MYQDEERTYTIVERALDMILIVFSNGLLYKANYNVNY